MTLMIGEASLLVTVTTMAVADDSLKILTLDISTYFQIFIPAENLEKI